LLLNQKIFVMLRKIHVVIVVTKDINFVKVYVKCL